MIETILTMPTTCSVRSGSANYAGCNAMLTNFKSLLNDSRDVLFNDALQICEIALRRAHSA